MFKIKSECISGSIRWEVKHGTYLASAYLISLLVSKIDEVGESSDRSGIELFATKMAKLGLLGLGDELDVVRNAASSLIQSTLPCLPSPCFSEVVSAVLSTMVKLIPDVSGGGGSNEVSDEHVSLLCALFTSSQMNPNSGYSTDM
jgi:hypothetical protein